MRSIRYLESTLLLALSGVSSCGKKEEPVYPPPPEHQIDPSNDSRYAKPPPDDTANAGTCQWPVQDYCFAPADMNAILQNCGSPPSRDASGCALASDYKACNPNAIGGPNFKDGQCCYPVCAPPALPGGRPLLVCGENQRSRSEARDDWGRALAACRTLDPRLARALSAAWSDAALSEHASVASFARFSLELMAIGAPSEFVVRAHRAALDEIEHARLCFGLAERFGAGARGPGRLPTADAAPRPTLRDVAIATFVEGCIAETVGAALVLAQTDGARDETTLHALERIARDEVEHARLAWEFVKWAIEREPELARDLRERAATALARTPMHSSEPLGVERAAWRASGFLTDDDMRRVVDRAHGVILLCLEAITAGRDQDSRRRLDIH